ncbi:S4 domain-containing protein [Actinotalea sp. M2MS4P-6]|uniref:RNA-binding S4 domain-containing protein n=1 Tax=Actinotalea sp. M2MS4P-6 TaxID=2983762 RepID=UPI0021E4C6F4|nr:S4 domain-containing protein [Actinotalea sp. M2MS4P-6]MCV2393537.1 S4 domain-containing protein [Actinotalea sp. M2MS4P-6]
MAVGELTSARVDAWVWAVRLAPSRTAASTACRGGHVRVNGDRAKPATMVKPGDEVRVRLSRGRGELSDERIVVVRRLLVKRVSASVAVEAYEDRTPPPPPREERPAAVAVRERGMGRPTKRDRRAIERLRGH